MSPLKKGINFRPRNVLLHRSAADASLHRLSAACWHSANGDPGKDSAVMAAAVEIQVSAFCANMSSGSLALPLGRGSRAAQGIVERDQGFFERSMTLLQVQWRARICTSSSPLQQQFQNSFAGGGGPQRERRVRPPASSIPVFAGAQHAACGALRRALGQFARRRTESHC